MKKLAIFILLMPLLSHAAPQEAWMAESNTPVELLERKIRAELSGRETASFEDEIVKGEIPQNQTKIADSEGIESKTEMRKPKNSKIIRQYKRSSVRFQKKKEKSKPSDEQISQQVNEDGEHMLLYSSQQKEKLKPHLHIETNRKPSQRYSFLREDQVLADVITEEKAPERQEMDYSKQLFRARERIKAKSQKMDEQIAVKRSKESIIKEERRSQKDANISSWDDESPKVSKKNLNH
jgi:hypothetical protein